jgi:hypothetical protein
VFWSPSVGYRLLTGTTSAYGGYSAEFLDGSLCLGFYDQYMAESNWTIPIATLTGK